MVIGSRLLCDSGFDSIVYLSLNKYHTNKKNSFIRSAFRQHCLGCDPIEMDNQKRYQTIHIRLSRPDYTPACIPSRFIPIYKLCLSVYKYVSMEINL